MQEYKILASYICHVKNLTGHITCDTHFELNKPNEGILVTALVSGVDGYLVSLADNSWCEIVSDHTMHCLCII